LKHAREYTDFFLIVLNYLAISSKIVAAHTFGEGHVRVQVVEEMRLDK